MTEHIEPRSYIDLERCLDSLCAEFHGQEIDVIFSSWRSKKWTISFNASPVDDPVLPYQEANGDTLVEAIDRAFQFRGKRDLKAALAAKIAGLQKKLEAYGQAH